jgi:hypothetical protein
MVPGTPWREPCWRRCNRRRQDRGLVIVNILRRVRFFTEVVSLKGRSDSMTGDKMAVSLRYGR